MPITFPPERFKGTSLSGMCVPDLRGTQGTFSYYTTKSRTENIYEGGEQHHVKRKGNTISAELTGPPNGIRVDNATMKTPFTITFNGEPDTVQLDICGKKYALKKGEYTPWITFHFNAAPGNQGSAVLHSSCCLTSNRNSSCTSHHYRSIRRSRPCPSPTPPFFRLTLRRLKVLSPPWDLPKIPGHITKMILQDPDFLHQCVDADREREIMFSRRFGEGQTRAGGLRVRRAGSGTTHVLALSRSRAPAHEGFGDKQLKNAICEQFERMDELVGKTMAECEKDGTMLLVISDHGCKSFRYGVDLNRWLIENGYMTLKEPANGKKYLATVDWSNNQGLCHGGWPEYF